MKLSITAVRIMEREKGDDRAARMFLSMGDRPDGADVGNGSETYLADGALGGISLKIIQ